jgi:hypothetical protein
MKRMTRFVAGFMFAFISNAAIAETIVYQFPMSAEQNIPVTESGGLADCTVTLNDETRFVSVECSFEGLAGLATNAYIHGLAGPDMNGSVLLPFDATNATTGTVSGSGTLSADEMAGMKAGLTYINLHTLSFAGGEIRGQIVQAFRINAGLNDAWVSADAPFQGLFFTVFENLNLLFLSWFTFDSTIPVNGTPAVFGAGDQRWVTGAGS